MKGEGARHSHGRLKAVQPPSLGAREHDDSPGSSHFTRVVTQFSKSFATDQWLNVNDLVILSREMTAMTSVSFQASQLAKELSREQCWLGQKFYSGNGYIIILGE